MCTTPSKHVGEGNKSGIPKEYQNQACMLLLVITTAIIITVTGKGRVNLLNDNFNKTLFQRKTYRLTGT